MKRTIRFISLLLLLSLCLSTMTPFVSAAVVSKGSSGTLVRQVQYDLNFLGYSVGSVDGICGSKTVDAIKKYQKARKLDVDGMAGPDTQKHLWAEVKEIQKLLKNKGVYTDTVDGIAGPNTIAAAKAFQKAVGLKQNGVINKAGLKTLKAWDGMKPAQDKENTSISWSNMKAFPDGGYSNYNVVKGYNKAYRFNQHSYDEYYIRVSQNGKYVWKNVGCTAVSVCMALSIKNGKATSPSDYYKIGWCSGGCNWAKTKEVTSKNSAQKLRQIADLLLQGKAVAMWANENHMVCVVGLKKTADLSKLKASDFLIIDPDGGVVTTLNNASYGYYYTGYCLYYAA